MQELPDSPAPPPGLGTDVWQPTPLAARGRTIIIRWLIALTALSVALSLAWTWKFGFTVAKLNQQVTRVALLWLLGVLMLQGRAWARWLTVALIIIGVMMLAPAFLRLSAWTHGELPGTLVLFAMYLVYVAAGRTLIYSPAVSALFREWKQLREANRQRRAIG